MEKIPTIFAQMRENLDPARVPKIHAETVAKQNAGVLSLIDTFIVPNADQLQGEDRKQLDAAVAGLRKAVAEQQTWLDKTLVPNAKGDFRIGQKLYDEKLQFSLNSSLSRAEIKQRAEAELKRVRGEMYGIAQTVLKDKPNAPELPADADADEQQQKAIEAALELAYADKPARDKVVDFAKQTLADATDVHARKHDLVTVPDDPVKIILMPEFQRGVAVAYCDSPGPLDKGLDTYYAISPIPDDWSARAGRFVPARVQQPHDPPAVDPRGDAGPLPGRRAFGQVALDPARGAAFGPVRRRLGGLHRGHDGRRRLPRQRSAVPPGAAEVLPAHDRQRDPRPGRARRQLDPRAGDGADDASRPSSRSAKPPASGCARS